MIDNDKQREFFAALAQTLAEKKTNDSSAEDDFSEKLFKLFSSLKRAGFTDEQAIALICAVLTAVARQ